MRVASIIAGVLALVAACSEPSAGPSRLAPTTPRYSADNGAEVRRMRDDRTFADTVTTCEGDTAAVEADVARRAQVVLLSNGDSQLIDHMVVRMRGTVLSSGVQYVGEMSWMEVRTSRGSDSGVLATETRTIRLHGVTQGPSDNVFETIRFETIYYEDSSYTVVVKGKAACPG